MNKTGLLLVGARGSIATTVLHGLWALREGAASAGMVTELPEFAEVSWASFDSFALAGWDIAGSSDDTASELVSAGVLPAALLAAGDEDRAVLEERIRPGVPSVADLEQASPGAQERAAFSALEAVEALRSDIVAWREELGLSRAVVVYLASVEPSSPLPSGWDNPKAELEALLRDAPAGLSPSLLYGAAAIQEGVPFVNFTPAPGGAAAALAAAAERAGVPILGNDGKTGETLVKTVLAPLFRDRNLRVRAWEGFNMLGNRDGAALADPDRKRGKLEGKDRALRQILADDEAHTGVHIEYVPPLNDWKTAWDYIDFEGFLGARMSLQFTWRGSDSALAAPLVLDLARVACLAQERGMSGPIAAAAPFFKAPLGTPVHDFHAQMLGFRKFVLQD